MKKVLSLVLALVLVLGMIPTFAADATGAQALYDNGFITGKDGADLESKLDVNAQLTRAQLAALIAELNGAKEEAAAFEQPADFTDFATIAGWAKNFVSYAAVNGWMNGFTDGTFRANASVPAQQLAAVLMNALGYEVVWNTVLADAAELGIVVEGTALTRGEAFEAMWVAVSEVKMADSDMTLGQHLGKLAPPTPVVTDLKITSVVADNLKAITVVFNQEVDEDTITATNVKVVRGTTTLTTAKTLSADGKTLTLVVTTPTNLTQSDSIKLVVEKVKSATAKEIAKYEETFVVNDTKVPTANSAIALNPKQIEVTFSEPVQLNAGIYTLMNDIKVSGTAIIAKAVANDVTNKVQLTLATAMAEGTHTIELKGVKDYAGFTAPTATLTFTVVKDEVAPVATLAEVKTKTSVKVTFNEPVETAGTFKINGVDVVTATYNADKTAVTLTVPGTGLDIGAVVEVKVEYKGQKDIMGNEVKEWTSILTKVADDTTVPTVVLTSVGTANKLTLTFSKSMAVAGTVELLNKDGVLVQTHTVTGFKTNSDAKVLEITFSSLADINPADYSIKIKDMKDATVRSNPLPTATLTFKAIDTKAPVVADEYVVTANTDSPVDNELDTITIFFSEAMDVASIETLANYYMLGVPFSANANAVSAKAAADAKSVVITYENASTTNFAGLNTISVFAVKDVAGNAVVTSGATHTAAKGVTTPLTVASVEASDVNTVKVTFNTVIKTVDPSVFVLVKTVGGEAVTGFVSATINATNQTIVTFKTASAMSTSAAIYSVKVNSPASIANIYNETLTVNALSAVADKIAPTLSSVVTTTDVNSVAVNNSIKFTFSEALNPANVAAFRAGLLVKNTDNVVLLNGLTGASTVAYDGTKVTVTFGGADLTAVTDGDDNGNKTIKVSFPVGAGINDFHANTLLPVADKDVTVKINN
jgi:hypothetical protein